MKFMLKHALLNGTFVVKPIRTANMTLCSSVTQPRVSLAPRVSKVLSRE